uniref:Phorbol-ester/DAG-type domain-containing protein n=1 Tax=Macrostomum lignano TaxID=282301 RepID=A0A1I8HPW4_9PLAT
MTYPSNGSSLVLIFKADDSKVPDVYAEEVVDCGDGQADYLQRQRVMTEQRPALASPSPISSPSSSSLPAAGELMLRARLPRNQRTTVTVRPGASLRDLLERKLTTRSLRVADCTVYALTEPRGPPISWDADAAELAKLGCELLVETTVSSSSAPCRLRSTHNLQHKTFFTIVYCSKCSRLLIRGYHCLTCQARFHQRCCDVGAVCSASAAAPELMSATAPPRREFSWSKLDGLSLPRIRKLSFRRKPKGSRPQLPPSSLSRYQTGGGGGGMGGSSGSIGGGDASSPLGDYQPAPPMLSAPSAKDLNRCISTPNVRQFMSPEEADFRDVSFLFLLCNNYRLAQLLRVREAQKC